MQKCLWEATSEVRKRRGTAGAARHDGSLIMFKSQGSRVRMQLSDLEQKKLELRLERQ